MDGSVATGRGSVLIASNFSSDTGYAWKFIYRLQSAVARTLTQHGLDIRLSFAQIQPPVTTLAADIPFEAFEFDPMHITPRSALALLRQIRHHRIRYAYLTDMPTYHWLYAVMRLGGVKRIVSHSHVSVANPDPATPDRGLRRALKELMYHTPMRADAVYAVSAFVAQRLETKARYPLARTFVIRYGIDLDRFACPKPMATGGALRVFLAARATRFKGVHTLIEATRLLKGRSGLPPFVVRYAGDGPDLELFRGQVREHGLEDHFVFLGALPGTLDELCAADIVVVPSIWGDASPLAAIEGLAAGKAVVASTAGGLPEIIGGPETGVLVPHGDAPALAEAIAALLSDTPRRTAMGENARRRAQERYQEASFYQTVAGRVVTDFGLGDAGHSR